MKTYAVTPSVDADGWFVKAENVAPTVFVHQRTRRSKKRSRWRKRTARLSLSFMISIKTLKRNVPFKKSLRPCEGFSHSMKRIRSTVCAMRSAVF